jgi:hypothetical protein
MADAMRTQRWLRAIVGYAGASRHFLPGEQP